MTTIKRQPGRSVPHGIAIAFLAIAFSAPAIAADEEEIAEIRRLLTEMRTDYEARITELERRLAIAEQAAAGAPASVARRAPPTVAGSVTSGNTFNPQISLVLDGNLYRDGIDGEGAELHMSALQPSAPGHTGDEHDHAHGPSNGFNLRSAELALVATVDPYFDAAAYFALESAGEIDIEEAWFATRSLPAGLKFKGGRFLSDFGYLNNKHEHQWDFVDQNLAYLNLLGDHGLQDNGVQLTWLPDLPVYTLFGAELLQGDQERIGTFIDEDEEREATALGDRKDGPRLWTLFAKFGPDLGYDHALQFGGTYVYNRQHQEIQGDPLFDTGLEGDAELWALDLIYKYDNAASYGHRDLTFQAEYLHSMKDLIVRSGDPANLGAARKLATDGLYVQGVYGFAPRWQAGLRYDVVGLTNEASGDVTERFGSSDRWSTVLTWTPTEFSRFRMQYSRSDILTDPGVRERFDTLWLQFLMSLGAHGAHRF